MSEDDRQPTQRAVIACAQWLAYCVEIGWRKDELDFLESLWWKYHDWRGDLVTAGKGKP